MKLYSLSILYKGATKSNLLKAATDLSSFSFFQRSSIQEFMTFTSALIVERTSQGSRASVKEQEYLCHVYVRNDSLGAVVIADTEYPQRVAFTLLDKVLDEFSRQVDSIDWPSGNPETINYKTLDIHLSKYQNPREADAMTKVQAELDETKIILHNTMESLLERGEKLDDLVAKSEHLGNQSKAFYKTDESEEGWKVVAGVKCDLSGLVTDGGAEGVMGSAVKCEFPTEAPERIARSASGAGAQLSGGERKTSREPMSGSGRTTTPTAWTEMVDPDLAGQLSHAVRQRNGSTAAVTHPSCTEGSFTRSSGIIPGAIAATVFIAFLLALYAVLWKCMVSPPQRKHSKVRVRVHQRSSV
ncbi:putative synaptobrevin -like YKT6 [Scophthalmus maximus]|uniref:Putative synaptobrevin-like YKT6 n=1 Tax=Scophthalmus maximus TaxID=52904 RepID=A0A2U9BU59_SCOMX|nr:putative synaptobrevin -like YKT6 [Scophthalmus maximus]